MWRHIASNFLTFLVVMIFLLGGVILWGQNQYQATGPLEDPICLQVPRGSSMRAVSSDLAAQGAITSERIFRIGTDYGEKTQLLKAGSWLIPEGSSMDEIADIVTRGGASTCGTEVVYRIGVNASEVEVRELDPATNRFVEVAAFDPQAEEVTPPAEFTEVREQADTRYRVAVAEGVTSWQVVNALGAVDALDGEVAGVPPEGSLAPNSYEFSVGDTRESVLTRMREAQELILTEAWQNRASDIAVETPEEALILASIIEKETGVSTERGQVASVFTNRLLQGMRLQTDPTVIYGITNGEGVLGRGLRQSELRAETPYNTYVIDGLPPTPIANPGRASIEAAVNPEDTDYVFFVARTLDPRDGHLFAETLEEHNRNVAAYRALEAERANQ
ncbi:endolytic transglycosylase MltG [Roseovarius atlanticus]|uniref:endolytic transglycosylase MltG n=1 Tax=Roseovarius atlanticus TaxID=1641875 RepID=UPI001C98193E|nr:endolytic transglycosylase MltG [Roseovarius atlanticus]MBY5988393.1 endolytic transglycosylase MltG [Roseovarius atlanticus]MBY6123784.1 endolytic transglycosylase MltG [Roseovarius atlanticus]MBY6148279.1 endolytic transglycosylase MltG [Roseovarius atlanticus]